MTKEELVKLVLSQTLLKKKLTNQIEELTVSNSSLCVDVEVRRNVLD